MARRLIFLLLFLISFSVFAEESQTSTLNLEAPALEVKKDDDLKSSWSNITPSLDSRFIFLFKEKPKTAGRQGFSIMQAILGLDFQISSNLAAVMRYNLGFLGTGARDVYLDFQTDWLNSIKVGRFPLKFGNKLSDHRIYTKRFFGVSINDFETGIEFAKTLGSLQATISLTQNPGGGEAFQNNEILLSPAFDLRWDFLILDIETTLGVSFIETTRLTGAKQSTDGNSVLGLFGELKKSSLSFRGEVFMGHKRNDLRQDLEVFVGDSAFASTLKGKNSLGFLALTEYSFNKKWKYFYEYNQVVFDSRYLADRFQKHSLGARWAFLADADLEFRIEKNLEGRTESPDLRVANDSLTITLHAWF